MLLQGAFLFNSSGGSGLGTYTVDVNFSDGSKAQYLNIGDTIADRLGVRFSVTTWAIFPSNFSNSGTVTVAPLDADIAPTDGLALGDGSVATPGQVDTAPQLQTGGTLSVAALIEGRTYKYQCTAGFSIGSEANKAAVGDMFLDNAGKPFEITALSGQPGAFAFPFEAVEVDKIGDGPNLGGVFLYRGTPNLGLYQGQALNSLAEDEVRNRDEFLTDLGLEAGAVAIGSGQIINISTPSGVVTNDSTLILVTESGAVTVALQGPFDDGKVLYVKDAFDGVTDRGVNTISIVPDTGLIDGAVQLDMLNSAQSSTLILSSGTWYNV